MEETSNKLVKKVLLILAIVAASLMGCSDKMKDTLVENYSIECRSYDYLDKGKPIDLPITYSNYEFLSYEIVDTVYTDYLKKDTVVGFIIAHQFYTDINYILTGNQFKHYLEKDTLGIKIDGDKLVIMGKWK